MKRGITFEIPNKPGIFLSDIFKPIEIDIFNWRIRNDETYLMKESQLGEPLFPENEMDGMLLQEVIEKDCYYVIFVELIAYPKGKQVIDIETYEDFINSECQLVLLIVDSSFTTIYCKNKEILDRLYNNAIKRGYDQVQYITDENDTRTRLSVW
ncbi:DUF2691 family protein [Peribacillus acanthi]|uniref:DUF2691 family protein n=1 Tax=Peribacillus acanthi TaxID=2171554 RepID=UPI000D3E642B|nr:DUF2691 family protein [Peribacillus acanthi]